MSQGFVYVFSNPAMPGVVKIGYTRRKPQARLKELNAYLGVRIEMPPFRIECFVWSHDAPMLEANLHTHFVEKRIHRDREFFSLEADDVASVMSTMTDMPVMWATGEVDVLWPNEPSSKQGPGQSWPWQRPTLRRSAHSGRKDRFKGGGSVYRWLYRRQPELDELETIDWKQIAFEYGRHQESVGGTFNPPPPHVLEMVWDRVQQWVFTNDGWDARRFAGDGSGSEPTPSGGDSGGLQGVTREEVGNIPVDDGAPRGTGGDVQQDSP